MKQFKRGYMAGVYDLFHVGHLNLINRAKEHCEYLMVGVLTDELVYHFKKKYPVISFEERSAIIAAIKGVDEVVPVTLENVGKMQSWEQLHFDVQFSGSDYENAPDWLADKKRLEEVGSTIMFFPYTQTTSSTDIRKKLLDSIEAAKREASAYKVTDKQRQIWNVELDILSSVEGICKKHNLRYFALHGTLLGAVRHKGFIPWDDDLDIGMLREDYDKFLEIAKEELPKHLFLQTMFTEEDVFYNGITRIRNSNTTGIQERELDRRCNKGIWIDILPIDNSPLEDALYREKCKKVSRYNLLLQAKFYGKEMKAAPYKTSRAGWLGCKLAAVFFPKAYLLKKLNGAMRIGDKENCELGIFTGHCNYRQLNRADFSDVTYLDFEGRKVSAPVGYENYLFMVMGSDYMQLPPENEQRPKHRGIFDANKPYTEYEKVFCGMFDNVDGKKLVLFGAGMMFDDYMKKFGRKYKPDFIVDNDKNKWGRNRQGVEIKSPEAILSVPAGRRKVIVCSAHYPEIEKQLQEMGITEYSVYIQHVKWITDTEQRR